MIGLRASMDASFLLTALFAATFLGVAFWEARRPLRQTVSPLTMRWFGNITLFGLAWFVVWLLPFLSGYGAALIAAHRGWGLFNLISLPSMIALAASFVLLDFSAYWTHRLVHKIPLLWRLHALHHSDTDLDVTTAIRHHPAETLVQSALDAALAFLFGFPPEAIVLYAGVVLAVQAFSHGNVVLPPRLRWVNRWLITPDLHRIHHSMVYVENNSNFGNLVPLWDRLFDTLRHSPEGEFKVGLPEFPGANFQRLDQLLIQPLYVAMAEAPGRNVGGSS